MGSPTPPLLAFAQEQGLAPTRACAVCRMGDALLIETCDDNERLPRLHPDKVSRTVVAAYLKTKGHPISISALQSHAARHLQEPIA